MYNNGTTYRALPLPFQEKKKQSVQPMVHYSRLSQPKRAKDEDVLSQSSYHVTGVRTVVLLVVLLGVTLSMMASFVFLFSGAHVRAVLILSETSERIPLDHER